MQTQQCGAWLPLAQTGAWLTEPPTLWVTQDCGSQPKTVGRSATNVDAAWLWSTVDVAHVTDELLYAESVLRTTTYTGGFYEDKRTVGLAGLTWQRSRRLEYSVMA